MLEQFAYYVYDKWMVFLSELPTVVAWGLCIMAFFAVWYFVGNQNGRYVDMIHIYIISYKINILYKERFLLRMMAFSFLTGPGIFFNVC